MPACRNTDEFPAAYSPQDVVVRSWLLATLRSKAHAQILAADDSRVFDAEARQRGRGTDITPKDDATGNSLDDGQGFRSTATTDTDHELNTTR